MESRPRIEIGLCVIIAAVFLAFMLKGMKAAHAHEAESAEASAVPCAVISQFTGEVELLDSSRSHLLKVEKSAPVPCGGWVSTVHGTVELKHRDGHRIHLGENTFAQLPEPNLDGHMTGDQIVLFRGQLYVRAGGGNGELRVATANARARVSRGAAVVVFNQSEEETQVIALENSSQLENRFETSRIVKIKPGEASSLNFKLLRVLPSTPRAVSIAALRPKFEELHVATRERTVALESARDREERTFASTLTPEKKPENQGHAPGTPTEHPAELKSGQPTLAKAKSGRAIASVQGRSGQPTQRLSGSYAPHELSEEEREQLHNQMVNRLVAGEPEGAALLHARKSAPRHSGKRAKVQVQIESHGVEDTEKRRLIEELSRIREEN